MSGLGTCVRRSRRFDVCGRSEQPLRPAPVGRSRTRSRGPSIAKPVRARVAWLALRARLPGVAGHRWPLPPSLDLALDNKLALYKQLATTWGRSVLIDSSKNAWEAIELAKRAPDRVLVLLLMRDGRGVYFSRRRSGFSQRESLRGWKSYYRRFVPLLDCELPASQRLVVRYEDFARDPASVGRVVCERLGLTFDPAMLGLEAGARHMVNGNDTRFAPARGIRLDERWRTELEAAERAYFEQHAGDLNRRLGYA